MQTKASPVLASARTVKIGGVDYRYGPLPYRLRGELENLYFPHARTMYQREMARFEHVTEEQAEQLRGELDYLRRLSLAEKPSIESTDAFEFFAESDENWAGFLAVVLPVFNAMRPESDYEGLALATTKGDRDLMYSQAVEVGEFAPKSFPRAAGGR